MLNKSQPRKAIWPSKSPTNIGEARSFRKGELLRHEGSAVAHSLPVEAKAQPWTSHWPPRTSASAGESHGFAEGQVLRLEGSAGAHPPPR